jgi:hypothetical protein
MINYSGIIKMSKKIRHLFYFLSVSIAILSCAQENPNLVNPPPNAGSVFCRFINLAGDAQSRELSLGSGVTTAYTPYGNASLVINPPADSVVAGTIVNNATEYSQKKKFVFVRDSYNSFFALPKPYHSPQTKPVDTLIMISSLTGLPVNTTNAYISVFDAYPDTTARYLINIGCPNGTSLEPNALYRSIGAMKTIPSGDIVFSLIRIKDSLPVILGLFEVHLQPTRQYMLVILANSSGQEELWLLDEEYEKYNTSPVVSGSLTKAVPVPERITYVRTVNFSADVIKAMKNDETIANSVSQDQIGTYNTAGACQSDVPDSLNVFVNGNPAGSLLTSLQVLQRYTMMVFDSVGTTNKLIMLAPQITQNNLQVGKSMIRVVFADFAYQNLTLSLGARDDTTNVGYSSGLTLASDVLGDISQPVAIRPGDVPMTLFTSTQPQNLLFSTRYNFLPDKSYLIILKNSPSNQHQIVIIEDNVENLPVDYLSNKVFADLVNLVAGKDYVNTSISGLLTNAILYYTYTLSTVINPGNTDFTINGKTTTVTADNTKRVLVIGSGTGDNTDAFSIVSDPMGAQFGVNYMWRFINASDIPQVNVFKDDTSATSQVASNLSYGTANQPNAVTLERNVSIFFKNSSTGDILLRSEVTLTKGINYSIILGGNKALGYKMVVQQQF